MKEFAVFFGIMLLWIVLNRWVLPWFGVQTCMSGGCAVRNAPVRAAEPGPQNDRQPSETKGLLK